MSLFEELKAMGVNIDEGLKRLNGNETLYKRLLGSFIKTIQTHSVRPDFDQTDYNEVIEKAHAIKGASGNLSITPVYESYTEIVNLLRAGQPEQAVPLIEKILPIQDEIVKCIAVFSCMTLIMSYNTEESIEKISNVYMSEMNQQIQQKFQTVTSLQLEQVEGIIKRSEPGTKSYGRELLDELQMSAEIRNFTFLALYSHGGNLWRRFNDC